MSNVSIIIDNVRICGTGWRFAVPVLVTECRGDPDFAVFLYSRQGWQVSDIYFIVTGHDRS